jgi:hypothetical protein
MEQRRSGVDALREAARQTARARPLRELAGGAAIGLLGLSAALGDSLLAGQLPALTTRRLLELLLLVPLLHSALVALAQAGLRPRLARHYRELLRGSQLLLWIVSGEFPPEYARLASLLGIGRTARQDFGPRLAGAVRHWRALCLAAGGTALPGGSWLGWMPVLAALGWTLAALAAAGRYGFSPLLYPVLFVALAFHLHGVLLASARDEFALALCAELALPAAADSSA